MWLRTEFHLKCYDHLYKYYGRNSRTVKASVRCLSITVLFCKINTLCCTS